MMLLDKMTQAVQLACALLAAIFILFFVYIALSTVHYPFNLEWMEGQSIDVIQRVVEGKPIYVAPSINYVPFIYTPFYFYASALVSQFTGVDFFPARLVSLLATLTSGFVLYFWARREGGSRVVSLAAAGLFFSTYELSGRWFDVARIDSLYVCLMLSGLYVFCWRRGWGYAFITAVLFTLAVMTKQSALVALFPALLAAFFIDWKHAVKVLAMFAVLLAGTILSFNYSSDGWFLFYVYQVLAGHGLEHKNIVLFWTQDMARDVGILLSACLIILPLMFRQQTRKTFWYCFMMAGVIGSVYASRIHWGTYLNVLMPLHAFVALAVGIALIHAEYLKTRWLKIVMWGLVCAQMSLSLYNPNRLIPDEDSILVGERFLEQMAEIKGDVFMPELQWVLRRAGKTSYTLGMPAYDIFRSDLGKKNVIREQLGREIQEAIASGRFAAIVPGVFLKLQPYEEHYKFYRRFEYPREYVTGAVNLTRTSVYTRIDPAENKPDE